MIDQRGGIVRFDVLRQTGNLLGGPSRQERGAAFGTELGERLHGETAIALEQQRERRFAFLVGELSKNLGEVGGMLLLQQVDQVGGRTNAQQSLD